MHILGSTVMLSGAAAHELVACNLGSGKPGRATPRRSFPLGERWCDTAGEPIKAHGESMIAVDGASYYVFSFTDSTCDPFVRMEGSRLGQVRLGGATTTHGIIATIPRPQASLSTLYRELGINR